MPDPDWPSPAECLRQYHRLCGGDPVAPSGFAAALLDPLVAFLRAVRPLPDEHLYHEAAEDALLSVIRNPAVFDPARGDLAAYLRMAAKADLLNRLARERRHQDRREARDCVELGLEDRNYHSGERDAGLPSFDDPALSAAVAALSDAERRVLDLMRAGERRTAAFAAALGLAARPAAEQTAEVKRVKDRIKQRLKRAGGGA